MIGDNKCEDKDVLSSQLRYVCTKFRVKGRFINFSQINIGNINKTYKVVFRNLDGTGKSYIAQKINTYVFNSPTIMMRNIDLVCSHIRDKNKNGITLHFHHTEDGSNYCITEDGSYWRLCNYIDSVTYNVSDDLDIIRSTGMAFGAFQAALADFDAELLGETIVNFHNTPKRITHLFETAEKDPAGRVKDVSAELEFVSKYRERASELISLLNKKSLPLRVAHNDTKTNNVLFDPDTLAPLAVIDLDTVMPGLIAYDFGDAVRSAASTCDEDEKNLSLVSLDIDKFTAYTEGFLASIKPMITENELNTLALGALTITLELGTRFLDDYLSGDIYFKIRYPDHNLVRAKCQFRLAEDIANKFDKMERIIKTINEIL